MDHFAIEHLPGQVGPAFPKPMLAGPDCLTVLHMSFDSTQDNLLRNLHWHPGQADRPAVACIFLTGILVDGCHIY